MKITSPPHSNIHSHKKKTDGNITDEERIDEAEIDGIGRFQDWDEEHEAEISHNNEGSEGRIYKGGKAYWPREREKDVVGDRSNLQESF